VDEIIPFFGGGGGSKTNSKNKWKAVLRNHAILLWFQFGVPKVFKFEPFGLRCFF
jgi:hypothetical protein